MSDEFGTGTVTLVSVLIDAGIGLHHTGHLGIHITGTPGTAARVGVSLSFRPAGRGTHLENRLTTAADDGTLFVAALNPLLEVTELNQFILSKKRSNGQKHQQQYENAFYHSHTSFRMLR